MRFVNNAVVSDILSQSYYNHLNTLLLMVVLHCPGFFCYSFTCLKGGGQVPGTLSSFALQFENDG